MTNAQVWLLIALLGVGTYLIRFSFLGLIGDRPLPAWVLRMLRYTPVAIIPGMVAPLVLWPEATGGEMDPARLAAAGAALLVGLRSRNVLLAIGVGGAVLYGALWLSGG
ncbi:AzlD domain-containing protein [Roseisalinus antarcticus]|uniref:Branched-chain amino acid transport protein (AzlD) n=1 Tax=Roseisalinus antarcticus TaxID=254357 RepID=A0A1Y5RNB3_9RHOB|nr:AzlD domain-containing protein [Roseisalinus antarcticus]SLN21588.1 Branched-chain amino acid transport protein (AzlD) [Roseisalinus antarcticus]